METDITAILRPYLLRMNYSWLCLVYLCLNNIEIITIHHDVCFAELLITPSFVQLSSEGSMSS